MGRWYDVRLQYSCFTRSMQVVPKLFLFCLFVTCLIFFYLRYYKHSIPVQKFQLKYLKVLTTNFHDSSCYTYVQIDKQNLFNNLRTNKLWKNQRQRWQCFISSEHEWQRHTIFFSSFYDAMAYYYSTGIAYIM
jgi:hypothetical protein